MISCDRTYTFVCADHGDTELLELKSPSESVSHVLQKQTTVERDQDRSGVCTRSGVGYTSTTTMNQTYLPLRVVVTQPGVRKERAYADTM